MGDRYLAKNNIKEVKILKDGVLLIVDNSCDEWLLKGNTLFHMDNRRKDNKVQFHLQRSVKDLQSAIKYIGGHSKRLNTIHKKQCRMEYLFSLI